MKKINWALAFLLFISLDCFSQTTGIPTEIKQTFVKDGIGIGSVIAIVVSWSIHKSIMWAILHGIFGWFYILYYMIVRKDQKEHTLNS